MPGCGPGPRTESEQAGEKGDVHTYSNSDQVRVSHITLDLTVDFESRSLQGSVTLDFESLDGTDSMVLDTRALEIDRVEASADGRSYQNTRFALGGPDPTLGAPLSIRLPASAGKVRIHYSTTPRSTALQWLSPEQTAGNVHPFLFTQSQAIHARSWIPLQDTPGVRTTYSARIRTPRELLAIMSAGNESDTERDGDYEFEMPQPIPSYLIALAVGDIRFQPLGPRTGVYAEPPVLGRAAAEFEDTEEMLKAAERLFGEYRWGRYDLLVLPPSFPFGGMENPRLTFATPTILAGDKSLVSLVAHELAHSWSGNLVTNATWSDFWLNEGFTVYIERRILEAVYGPERVAMEAVLGRQTLDDEFNRLPERDQALWVDLEGRDPDDGFTEVPYEKGALFLRTLEEAYGRERFDEFLNGYFATYAFRSIATKEFLDYLQIHLFEPESAFPVREWVYEPGVPEGAWEPASGAFSAVEAEARPWIAGETDASHLQTDGWTTQEWLHLLNVIPEDIGARKMAEADKAFDLTDTGNSEILCDWLVLAVKNRYKRAYPRLEEFLTSQGRRKFLVPLYKELVKTQEGTEMALAIYRKARPTYHPISVKTIDEIVGWE